MMISPVIDNNHLTIPVDYVIAMRVNTLYFSLLHQAWEKFHEMLLEQADRSNREHRVQSDKHRQLEASYHEGIRIAMARRQASLLKISEGESLAHPHLNFQV